MRSYGTLSVAVTAVNLCWCICAGAIREAAHARSGRGGRRADLVRDERMTQGRYAHLTEEDVVTLREMFDDLWDERGPPAVAPPRACPRRGTQRPGAAQGPPRRGLSRGPRSWDCAGRGSPAGGAGEALGAIGAAYRCFGPENLAHYRLMFGPTLLRDGDTLPPEVVKAAVASRSVLTQVIRRLAADGHTSA